MHIQPPLLEVRPVQQHTSFLRFVRPSSGVVTRVNQTLRTDIAITALVPFPSNDAPDLVIVFYSGALAYTPEGSRTLGLVLGR